MADQEQVTLNIDGVDVTVPKGITVLEAAKRAGVLVPHYCYHPGLPVAGVCRMCLVEIEGAPKLQIACATQVAEGQVVRAFADEAKEARNSVLEFLLINHPLDCPICDQAGECELQDFVFQEGRANTRYGDYPKRFNPVEDFGGDILYVPNRCILCTRCVRFMDDVAQEDIINVSERGDRAFIGIHPDRMMDHAWAGNVVDLCPVGSLLSKDTLHKARAWELDKTPSVCTSCSQGCSISIDTRNGVVVRLRPRPNAEVNQYFICDHGRHNYRWMNRGDRIDAPLVAGADGLAAADWDTAIAEAARMIRGAGGKAVLVASPSASNEALFMAKHLLANFDLTSVFRVDRVTGEEPLAAVENLALREERAANMAGAVALGYREEFEAGLASIADAAVVIVLDESLDGLDSGVLGATPDVIYLGTVLPEQARSAGVVLPIANVAEEDGSFVNRDGRVQRYLQAKAAPGMARPAWWILGELLRELERGEPLVGVEEAFALMAEHEPGFKGLTHSALGLHGALLTETSTADAAR